MTTTYPGTAQAFTNPTSTDFQSSPPHDVQHSTANDTLEAIQDVLGTTAGTSVLKNFSAGHFPVRVNTGGTLVQTVVGGTINSSIFGTPAITGGTITSSVINSSTFGTISITGGTINTSTLGTPTITGGTVNSATMGSPTLTGGTWTSGTINTSVLGTPSITGLGTVGIGASWDSFTPSWDNITVGNGTTSGAYMKVGKTVNMRAHLGFGSTTSVLGVATLDFPVAPATIPTTSFIGLARLRCAGTTYVGIYNNLKAINALGAAGAYLNVSAISSTVPATWTTGDEITIQATYECV